MGKKVLLGRKENGGEVKEEERRVKRQAKLKSAKLSFARA